jgi:competence protein ComEA
MENAVPTISSVPFSLDSPRVTKGARLTIMVVLMCETPRHPHWLLRRTDQAVVAALVVVALVGMAGWWMAQGGWGGRLVEIDHAEPLVARFQVDINAAEWPELTQLPAIGPTLAKRIVESRRRYGPFASHDDLRRVPGIGPKKMEEIRPYLRPITAK